MKAAGVCGSDIHLFLGENPNAVYPRIPGHENAGVVVEIGKNVTAVKPGDAVVVDLVVACGRCPQCLRGREISAARSKRAVRRPMAAGGNISPFPRMRSTFCRGKSLSGTRRLLTVRYWGHCTSRAGIQGGESVLVLGSGTIGAVILQTLKQKGCRSSARISTKAALARAKVMGPMRS